MKIFNFLKKKEVKEVGVIDYSKYDGSVYRGAFLIDGNYYEGAYVRDGYRTFVTTAGVAKISRGVKIQQIKNKPVAGSVENYLRLIEAGAPTPLITIC